MTPRPPPAPGDSIRPITPVRLASAALVVVASVAACRWAVQPVDITAGVALAVGVLALAWAVL